MGEVYHHAQLPPRVPAWNEQTPRPTPPPLAAPEEVFFSRDAEPSEPTPPPEETPPPPDPAPVQFVWPVYGRVETSHSAEHLIFDQTMGDWRTHVGIDIAAELGEPVLAIAAGTIERVFHDDLLGTTVVINHGGGLQSLYANLMEVPTVEEGQWVAMGTPIGAVGATAIAKAGLVHHVHLEVIEHGVQVDPLRFLPPR